MIRSLCLIVMLAATPVMAAPMVAWDAAENGDPSTYRIEGLSLRLASNKDEAGSTVPVLTVRARGLAPFVVRGEPGFPDASARFAVGVFDPKADGPQVLFTTFSGGAHCCNRLVLAERKGGAWSLVDLGIWDGDGLQTVPVDVDGDGVVDFVLVDNEFLYIFSSYAGSWPPPMILNVVDGKVSDVSAAPRFRRIFLRDMEKAKAQCAAGSTGACAGYVADAARTGRFDAAWPFMLAHYDRSFAWTYPMRCLGRAVDGNCKGRELKPKDFPQSLRWFLEDDGYLPKNPRG